MVSGTQDISVGSIAGVSFAGRIAEASGQPITTCYQCQRCTSWCPVAEFMDLMPHQLVRLIQLGLAERLYESRSIWLCVGCAGCGASCPNDIDFHHVADALQQSAGDQARDKAKALTAFDKAFLASVRANGRINEMTMVMRFKFTTMRLWADTKLGMWMFLHRKLSLLGGKIRGKDEIRQMFRRASQRKEERR